MSRLQGQRAIVERDDAGIVACMPMPYRMNLARYLTQWFVNDVGGASSRVGVCPPIVRFLHSFIHLKTLKGRPVSLAYSMRATSSAPLKAMPTSPPNVLRACEERGDVMHIDAHMEHTTASRTWSMASRGDFVSSSAAVAAQSIFSTVAALTCDGSALNSRQKLAIDRRSPPSAAERPERRR